MVTRRSNAPENLNITEEQHKKEAMENEDVHAHKVSEYELSREERIKENRERMQKLGILDLSLNFNALKPTPKRTYNRKPPQSDSPSLPSGPVRRSSRLQNSTPVSYCEVQVAKKDKSLDEGDSLIEEGSKPEIYTEEHEKLLGSTEMSWTLFVDGYGKDGKRIYDPVRGKTCHQCRQKTLGHRTHCSKCKIVQGQFCGDCLFMRYGENVLEANQNPNWICPVCRGICNCSLCRQAKGWPPTGSLYRKISSLGYKSVAHYLIQTRRGNPDSDKSAGTKAPISAKRSLPFSDIEVTVAEPVSECVNADPSSEFGTEFGDSKGEPLLEPAVATESKDQLENPVKPEPENNSCGYENEKESNLLVDNELDKTSIDLKTTAEPFNDHFLPKSSNQEIEKEKNNILDNKDAVAREASPKSTKKRVRFEPTPDSIGGRLKQRRNKNNTNEELVNAGYSTSNAEGASITADVHSIASRLKMRRRT
ncbi:hypothetical protein CDL12_28400 [Handroanthus impetiginosus]|uniref:Zinc-finger domain-containing protein n=1 Tax=Handroanthus impetiginosus TaxID=429701 RepID=A0A2G9G1C8_9LAMI|nr:hypothetical protein CDL12_28400 [Handroanthus impetiginosus]